MDGLDAAAGQLPAAALVEGEPTAGERGAFVRDRAHRFPGRRNALKVLYDDVELASVRAAAQLAGLTPTGYVAAAGLTMSGARWLRRRRWTGCCWRSCCRAGRRCAGTG
jgi:hypothetical protein